jgi:hypothetical protein
LVGGFIGRFPPEYAEQYARMQLIGNLLRVSTGERPLAETQAGSPPCRYLVVHRDFAPAAVVEYVHATLALQWLAGDGHVDLFRVN